MGGRRSGIFRRRGCAKDFASRYGIVLVLKNTVSIITDGKNFFLNTTGCSGMAKGGSGDVLSGFIGGVVATKTDCLAECVASACYIFGKAGEIAQSKESAYTVTAMDIISELGNAINSLKE